METTSASCLNGSRSYNGQGLVDAARSLNVERVRVIVEEIVKESPASPRMAGWFQIARESVEVWPSDAPYLSMLASEIQDLLHRGELRFCQEKRRV